MQDHFMTGKEAAKQSVQSPSEAGNILCRPTVQRETKKCGDRYPLGLGSQSIQNYVLKGQIGEGTYGKVYKAKDKTTNETVALKFIRMEQEKEGFPITCLREVKILQELEHKNIINMKDLIFENTDKGYLTYLVFEYMNHDLMGLLRNDDMVFDEMTVNVLLHQILEGLSYCHKNNIIHRDLKTSNILVNCKGEVKLADFGLARTYVENRPFTNRVISLWYRPVELIYGDEMYDSAIDIWSVGCIAVELFQKTPLFAYNTEIEMVSAIYKLCGTPSTKSWPEASSLPRYKTLKPKEPLRRTLREFFYNKIPALALDLIDLMLVLNPRKRITAADALKTHWMLLTNNTTVPIVLPKFDSLEMRMKKIGTSSTKSLKTRK
jgi:cyclin-dependent kinase 12/13